MLILIIIAFRFLSGKNADAEADFIKAQLLFTQFQLNEPADQEEAKKNLEQLEILMNKYPDLHAKYDGAIAQSLLTEGNSTEAALFADRVFKRTKPDQLDLYKEFAQTSLLIGSGDYKEALEKARLFKQTLEENGNSNSLLSIYNTIRLAMLYQQLGQSTEEKQNWAQVAKNGQSRGRYTA